MRATILVGSVIRELRKQRKLSQEQLALRADLTTSYIGMLERGLKSPTVDTLEKLSSALEVNIAELFHSSEKSKNDSQLKKLSERVEHFSDPTKSKFIETVYTLASLIKCEDET